MKMGSLIKFGANVAKNSTRPILLWGPADLFWVQASLFKFSLAYKKPDLVETNLIGSSLGLLIMPLELLHT